MAKNVNPKMLESRGKAPAKAKQKIKIGIKETNLIQNPRTKMLLQQAQKMKKVSKPSAAKPRKFGMK